MNYALGDKVVGTVDEEEFRSANPLYAKEFFSFLGKKAFAFDHGSHNEFNPEFEYNVGDVVLYKKELYVCTSRVLPQQKEFPCIGSKYWQLLGVPQVFCADYSDQEGYIEVTPNFREYSSFFIKVKNDLKVRIPASENMRRDGCYDLFISHPGVKISFNYKFEGSFIPSRVASVEHIKVFISGGKTYLVQEVTSLGNIIGSLQAYLESSGYCKKKDVYDIIK